MNVDYKSEGQDKQVQDTSRYVPFVKDLRIRTTWGFILLVLSIALAHTVIGEGRIEVLIAITALAWVAAVVLTQKYVHKYSQRYYTYLVAVHLKAAITMASFLWLIGMTTSRASAPYDVLGAGYAVFIFADGLVSVPRRRDIKKENCSPVDASFHRKNTVEDEIIDSMFSCERSCSVNTTAIIDQVRSKVDQSLFEFIEKNFPDCGGENSDVLVLDDVNGREDDAQSAPVTVLIGRIRINDVLRLNRFLTFCTARVASGGFIVLRYMPLENVIEHFRRRYRGLSFWIVYTLHFLWYRGIPKIPWLDRLYFSPLFSWMDSIHLSLVRRRNRALARAEVWGRLSFWGMRVITESRGDGELYIMAQRISSPHKKIPTYYPIAPLEKVGLDGQIFRTHKIRTMYPFSEFLQQRVYEDHGLSPTGKFVNDFRLTDYGAFLRKYWLDELPGIFDWLRGDIKLVGMRATSPQYLSLYPKEVYDLYIHVKPGLIPPIFGESTRGFDEIVKVEFAYLKSYLVHPIRTDIRYFFKTFTDIVLRGVRSN